MNSLMLLPSGSGGALAMQEELAAVTVAVAFIEIHATAAAAGSDGAEPLCRRRMQLHTSEVPHARLQLSFAAAAFVQVDVTAVAVSLASSMASCSCDEYSSPQ